MSDQSVWFYLKTGIINDDRIGPMTADDLSRLLSAGEFDRKTIIHNSAKNQNYHAEKLWPDFFNDRDARMLEEKQKNREQATQQKQLKKQQRDIHRQEKAELKQQIALVKQQEILERLQREQEQAKQELLPPEQPPQYDPNQQVHQQQHPPQQLQQPHPGYPQQPAPQAVQTIVHVHNEVSSSNENTNVNKNEQSVSTCLGCLVIIIAAVVMFFVCGGISQI